MIAREPPLPPFLLLSLLLEVGGHARVVHAVHVLVILARLELDFGLVPLVDRHALDIFRDLVRAFVGHFLALDHSVHFRLDVEHFGVLIRFEVVAIVQLTSRDFNKMRDVDLRKSLRLERRLNHGRHRVQVAFRDLERASEVGKSLRIEGHHFLVFRMCVPGNVLLTVDSAAFVGLLEAFFEVLVFEEVGVALLEAAG